MLPLKMPPISTSSRLRTIEMTSTLILPTGMIASKFASDVMTPLLAEHLFGADLLLAVRHELDGGLLQLGDLLAVHVDRVQAGIRLWP